MPFLYSRVGTGHARAPTIFRKVCADLRSVEDAAPLIYNFHSVAALRPPTNLA